MNDQELKQTSQKIVTESIHKANEFYNIEIDVPSVSFKLKGKIAGQCRSFGIGEIKINLQLMRENHADYIEQTIPHEVAHLIADKLFDNYCSHGQEWQRVMLDCFGLEPTRCHDYKVSQVRRFKYHCACGTHMLSKMLHNKIQSGRQIRTCNGCSGRLTFN